MVRNIVGATLSHWSYEAESLVIYRYFSKTHFEILYIVLHKDWELVSEPFSKAIFKNYQKLIQLKYLQQFYNKSCLKFSLFQYYI